jgi:hypothetical protein
MASETIKALLMITLFCGLQAALHLPRLINSRTVKRWRRAMILHRPHLPTNAPISYALIPVRVRRSRHAKLSPWQPSGRHP